MLLDGVIFSPVFIVLTFYNLFSLKSIAVLLLVSIAGALYKPLFEYKYGATPGKMILKLKVVNYNFEKISLREAFLRASINITISILSFALTLYLFLLPAFQDVHDSKSWTDLNVSAKLMPLELFLSLFLIADVAPLLWDQSKRTVHDLIAKTHVVEKYGSIRQATWISPVKKTPTALYVITGLSFIPIIGLWIGLVLLILGIVSYKDKILIIVNSLGVLFSVGIISLIVYQMPWKSVMRAPLMGIVKVNLDMLAKDIEYYKEQHGNYPDNLREVLDYDETANILDPLSMPDPLSGTKQEFQYQSEYGTYLLYSVGIDSIANTDDDIYPNKHPLETPPNEPLPPINL